MGMNDIINILETSSMLGLSYNEIATILKTTSGNIKTQINWSNTVARSHQLGKHESGLKGCTHKHEYHHICSKKIGNKNKRVFWCNPTLLKKNIPNRLLECHDEKNDQKFFIKITPKSKSAPTSPQRISMFTKSAKPITSIFSEPSEKSKSVSQSMSLPPVTDILKTSTSVHLPSILLSCTQSMATPEKVATMPTAPIAPIVIPMTAPIATSIPLSPPPLVKNMSFKKETNHPPSIGKLASTYHPRQQTTYQTILPRSSHDEYLKEVHFRQLREQQLRQQEAEQMELKRKNIAETLQQKIIWLKNYNFGYIYDFIYKNKRLPSVESLDIYELRLAMWFGHKLAHYNKGGILLPQEEAQVDSIWAIAKNGL